MPALLSPAGAALLACSLASTPLGLEAHVGRLHQHSSSGLRAAGAEPPRQVGATVGGTRSDINPISTSTSARYLIASFPNLKQVAYVHLPDNVWRPLVLGRVEAPGAVAADSANGRLFVADPANKTIWWYYLIKRPNGLLETTASKSVAVHNYTVSWMAVNGMGDLYFVGRKDGADHDAVYRQTALTIASGSAMDPTEMFSRSNSGNPNSLAWAPSGLAVDAFHVYWGNQDAGEVHGSIIQAPRHDSGTANQDTQLKTLNSAFNEVRGMTVTGTHIFWVAPDGVHGMRKGMASAPQGLIATAPAGSVGTWLPKSITFDGDASLYFTDQQAGILYQLPALNLNSHELTKFADAPNIDSVAVVEFSQAHPHAGATGRCAPRAPRALLAALPMALAVAVGS